MLSQLARLKVSIWSRRMSFDYRYIGPLKVDMKGAANDLKLLKGKHEKHILCHGKRSLATAIQLLDKEMVIAVPTDTIYGLACDASSSAAICRLYNIKGRDKTKPLSICLPDIDAISKFAVIDHLPHKLLSMLLPGPYTIVLKRTEALNPELNPGIDTVGVRVPDSQFVRCIAKLIPGALALTSANRSNEINTVHPDEFSDLWPKLAGIFYTTKNLVKSERLGSTIIDLSQVGCYKILRSGTGIDKIVTILNAFGITSCNHE